MKTKKEAVIQTSKQIRGRKKTYDSENRKRAIKTDYWENIQIRKNTNKKTYKQENTYTGNYIKGKQTSAHISMETGDQ